jgi:hypothetical protein
MFDSRNDRAVILKLIRHEDDDLPGDLSGPEALKEHCLDPAALWLLNRRAHLPYRGPQRLPAVARVG